MERIKIPGNGKVADLGCGGYNIRRMLEMSAKAKFIGLDISDESVNKKENLFLVIGYKRYRSVSYECKL